ncbi:MAG: hypothetical protein Q9195_005343 [Heterodermia aff. obscurata]
MTAPTINKDVSNSKSLNHLVSLPAVSTGIETFKTNPLGGKLVSIANQGHDSIIAPALPYTSGPYEYVQPYAVQVDSLAEGGLSKVEESFPIVTEDVGKITSTIKGVASDLAFLPFRKVFQLYNYVSRTYYKEHDRCGGRGVVAGGIAIATTQLVITGDGLAMFSSSLTRNKQRST